MLLEAVLVASVLNCAVCAGEGNCSLATRKVWSECDASGSCFCGRDVQEMVFCENDYLWIKPCYCIYYDDTFNRSILGSCMSTCFNSNSSEYGKRYVKIERLSVESASKFNDEMCKLQFFQANTHRGGRFCGQCVEGYGLAAYSYHYTTCIPCTDYGYLNWLQYFAVALLPLTFFYFLVVLLQINVTSSYLNGLVLTVQCLLSPMQLRIFDAWVTAINGGTPHSLKISANIATSLFGIVNLDFFRTLYPHFCLHPDLNFIHITSLDFIITLYPFLLIGLTYLLVTLYDKKYRIVFWAWKPFQWCLKRYRKCFVVKVSLIETFATFILLSNVKILGICFDLLLPATAVDETGVTVSRRFSYYDANIEYFGSAHMPFALLALFAGFIFVILPFVLLIIYPCRFFQQWLNCTGQRCQALHIFMDAFQGSYKIKPHDLRCFSAYHLLVRFSLLFTTSYIVSAFFVPVSAFVLAISSFVFLTVRPYKCDSHNRTDAALMLLMALFYIGISADLMGTFFAYRWLATAQVMFGVSFLLLVLYIFAKFVAVPVYHRLRTRCTRPNNCTPELEEFDRSINATETEYPSLLSEKESIITYT